MKSFRASDFRQEDGGASPIARTRVSYHADLAAVQAVPPLGRAFVEATAPFDRAEWFAGLAAQCGLDPLYAAAHDDAGNAVMLPLAHGKHRLEALANWYSFRWRPLIAGNPAAAPALIAALAADLAQRTGRITLAPLADEDGAASLLAAAFRTAGWVVERQRCDTNHILPVRGRNWALTLAGRPGPLRTTLARKAGKVRCTVHTAFTVDLWATYEAIYAASWKPAEGHPAFLRAFAVAEAEAGRLRLGLAHAGADPVAAQFWTVEAGTAFIHKLAHCESAHTLSPGTSLTAAMLEHVIDHDHVALVDFGTGDDPYKRDWMEATRPRWRLDMVHPASPRHWPWLARAGWRAMAGRKDGASALAVAGARR